jgi:microcystin-dependent protein
MGWKLGNTSIGEIYLGSTKIGQAYLGSTLVYTSAGPAPTPSIPAGIVEVFAGSTVPAGFLLCDGSAVSRDTYAALFAVIGTTYGAGDGSTTFNVPDISGRVVIGPSSTHLLGSTGGSETVTLVESELPAHTHEVPQHGHANDIKATTPSLSHTITQPVFKYNNANARNTTSGSSNSKCAGKTTSTATRSANVAIADHAATACTMSGGVTNRAAFSSNSTGGGGAHNNLQPFTTVNYIICTGD